MSILVFGLVYGLTMIVLGAGVTSWACSSRLRRNASAHAAAVVEPSAEVHRAAEILTRLQAGRWCGS